MEFILDTNCFRMMDSYYPDQFRTYWINMDHLVGEGIIYSVDQVYQELSSQIKVREHVTNWIEANKEIFRKPLSDESVMIAEILRIPKFQESLKVKKRLEKGPFADPWLVAAGYVHKACVITEETRSPNSSKIPIVCEYFGVPWMNHQKFMEQMGWRF